MSTWGNVRQQITEGLLYTHSRLNANQRKTLVNNLRHARLPGYSTESMLLALQNSGTDGTRRAETLTAEEFGLLTNCFMAKEKA